MTRDKTARHCSCYCSADTDHPDSPPTGEGVRRRPVSFRERRSAHTVGAPDLPPFQRSGASTSPPDLLVCTPALRPGGLGPSRAITTAGTLQDDRHNPRRTKDEIQDDSDARRLPTVYFLQYPTTVPPQFRGKRRLPCSHSCAPPLLVTIKGGGGLPLDGTLKTLLDISYRGHLHPRPSPHSTPLLTET